MLLAVFSFHTMYISLGNIKLFQGIFEVSTVIVNIYTWNIHNYWDTSMSFHFLKIKCFYIVSISYINNELEEILFCLDTGKMINCEIIKKLKNLNSNTC